MPVRKIRTLTGVRLAPRPQRFSVKWMGGEQVSRRKPLAAAPYRAKISPPAIAHITAPTSRSRIRHAPGLANSGASRRAP